MTNKPAVSICIETKTEGEPRIIPLILNIFGQRYRVESRIELFELPTKTVARVVPIRAGQDPEERVR